MFGIRKHTSRYAPDPASIPRGAAPKTKDWFGIKAAQRRGDLGWSIVRLAAGLGAVVFASAKAWVVDLNPDIPHRLLPDGVADGYPYLCLLLLVSIAHLMPGPGRRDPVTFIAHLIEGWRQRARGVPESSGGDVADDWSALKRCDAHNQADVDIGTLEVAPLTRDGGDEMAAQTSALPPSGVGQWMTLIRSSVSKQGGTDDPMLAPGRWSVKVAKARESRWSLRRTPSIPARRQAEEARWAQTGVSLDPKKLEQVSTWPTFWLVDGVSKSTATTLAVGWRGDGAKAHVVRSPWHVPCVVSLHGAVGFLWVVSNVQFLILPLVQGWMPIESLDHGLPSADLTHGLMCLSLWIVMLAFRRWILPEYEVRPGLGLPIAIRCVRDS